MPLLFKRELLTNPVVAIIIVYINSDVDEFRDLRFSDNVTSSKRSVISR